jgi:hypothetical protein
MSLFHRVSCAALFALSVPLTAQTDPLGLWAIYFGNYGLAPRWSLFADAQQRFTAEPQNQRQTMLRLGIQRSLTDRSSFLVGAAGIPSQIVGEESRFEFRIFEQFMSDHRWGRSYVRHRFRLEQRFLGNELLRQRLRYFVLLNIPLIGTNQGPGVPYLSAYNELFVQGSAKGYWDRNRFFLGLGYSFSPSLRMEFGAMAQTSATGTALQWNAFMLHSIPFLSPQ